VRVEVFKAIFLYPSIKNKGDDKVHAHVGIGA
jgi:hypothetical protein